MATKTRRRSRYSDQQRTAAAERDAHIRELAQQLPDDEADYDPRIAALTGTKLRTYSLRNQALLLAQADERDMTLTEVDTFQGWLRRGRCVAKGQASMRIVRFRGQDGETKEQAEDKPEGKPADEKGEQDGEKARQRFGFMSVWDVSQTRELDDSDAVA